MWTDQVNVVWKQTKRIGVADVGSIEQGWPATWLGRRWSRSETDRPVRAEPDGTIRPKQQGACKSEFYALSGHSGGRLVCEPTKLYANHDPSSKRWNI